MTDNRRTLSRRKLLGGLGAVGLASAGAGLGTTAYFNDTESFENNSLTAGTLDLALDWRGQYNDEDVAGLDPDDQIADGIGVYRDLSGAADGPAGVLVSLDDLAPGDRGVVEIGFLIRDVEHVYLWLRTRDVTSAENGYAEAEPRTDTSSGPTNATFTGRGRSGDFNDSGDQGGEGELVDELELFVSHTDGQYSRDHDADGPAPDVEHTSLAYLDHRGDIAAGSARHVLGDALADGVKLYRDPGGGDDRFAPAPTEPNAANASIAFEFELPADVENNVQTDSSEFIIDVAAGQTRHDDGTTNPFDSLP